VVESCGGEGGKGWKVGGARGEGDVGRERRVTEGGVEVGDVGCAGYGEMDAAAAVVVVAGVVQFEEGDVAFDAAFPGVVGVEDVAGDEVGEGLGVPLGVWAGIGWGVVGVAGRG
jgi:hypothetical protein